MTTTQTPAQAGFAHGYEDSPGTPPDPLSAWLDDDYRGAYCQGTRARVLADAYPELLAQVPETARPGVLAVALELIDGNGYSRKAAVDAAVCRYLRAQS